MKFVPNTRRPVWIMTASSRAEGKEDVCILICFDICFPADSFWSIAAVFIFSSTGEQPIFNNFRFQNMFIVVSSVPSVAIFLAPGNGTQFISLLSRAQREPHYCRVQNSESASRNCFISSVIHKFYFSTKIPSIFINLRALPGSPVELEQKAWKTGSRKTALNLGRFLYGFLAVLGNVF